MHVITLLNEKGGVGKTTLSTHIAAGLAVLGYRVILADADPQGHASVSLGVKRGPGLYDLLVREASFRDVLVPVPPETYAPPNRKVDGQLYVISSNEETRAIPLMTSDGLIVLKRLNELRNAIDVVIFDTSPTPSLLHSSIYMATHSIVYPTECEYLSLDGLNQSLRHRDMIQPTRSQWGLDLIEIMGIVPMKYRAKTILHQHNLKKMREQFGRKVWPPLALRTIWGEASYMRKPVFNMAPDSVAAKEIWQVVNRVQEAIS
ncbi:MAG: ParA family protein [Anaerolineae bacterium]|nr:ParA family protein [Anaerolineae bacterium]